MNAKGHDWTIAILKNARRIATLTSFNSIDIDFGLDVEVHNYVGRKRPAVNGTNKEATFACPFDVDSPEYLQLCNFQRLKNLPNADAEDIRIDIACAVDFGPQGRGRYGFSDCTLSGAGLSVSGRTESNTTSSPTFTAPEWELFE